MRTDQRSLLALAEALEHLALAVLVPLFLIQRTGVAVQVVALLGMLAESSARFLLMPDKEDAIAKVTNNAYLRHNNILNFLG